MSTFKHVAGQGGLRGLGSLPGFRDSSALDASALRDVLLEQGSDVAGRRLSFPFGMSADGRVIGGLGINPAGAVQAWLAHLAATEACTPPSITAVAATPGVLWPPNQKLISVVSDKPSGDPGDIPVTGELTALLRADKSAGSTGRTYTITVECVDTAGHSATGAPSCECLTTKGSR